MAGPAAQAATRTQYNWAITYATSNNDGLVVSDAYYKGVLVFKRGSAQFVGVDYPSNGFTFFDEMGYGPHGAGIDAQATPVAAPAVNDYGTAFEIVQEFRTASWPAFCTYGYRMRWTFNSNGDWWGKVDAAGPGCTSLSQAWYKVYHRIDGDLAGSGGDYFYQWVGATYSQPAAEHSFPNDGGNAADGHEWKSESDPLARKMFEYPVANDNETAWIFRYAPGQGSSDTAGRENIGSYDTNEGIQNADIVHWFQSNRVFTPPACNASSSCTSASQVPYSISVGVTFKLRNF